MSYLATGTTYTNSQATTNYLPGLREGGQDYVGFLNTATGTVVPITTSRVFHNVSGIATYSVAALTTELQSPTIGTEISSAPATFQVIDAAGHAGSANITISGVGSVVFNGAQTATISSNYGVKTFVNVTGNYWNAF